MIEIGGRNYLLYLVLPHPMKIVLLSGESRARLDRINSGFNERAYSGEGAEEYDRIHRYEGDAQHEYPARLLVEKVWGAGTRPGSVGDYGRALEIGAGSGYFTTLIARRARSVVAVEPVVDMQNVIRARCNAVACVSRSGAPAVSDTAPRGEPSDGSRETTSRPAAPGC